MTVPRSCILVLAATAPEARLFPPDDGIAVRRTGMGATAALAALQAALASGQVGGIVSFGMAGGLTDRASSGQLLLPAVLVNPTGGRVAADPRWHADVLARLGAFAPDTGPLQEVDRVCASAEEKAAWRGRTAACAVDMESAALARRAADAGVPFLALRVVVDGPGDVIPPTATAAIGPDGALALPGLLAALLRRPRDLPALLALSRLQRRAGRRLAAAAQQALPALRQPPSTFSRQGGPGGIDATVLAQ